MLKPHEHQDKFESVGTPVLGFELRIVDEDNNAVASGAVGEIVGYGAGLMHSYHGRPEQTADLIWFDERGRSFVRSGRYRPYRRRRVLVSVVGRKKDMIISGGFNVFPADIEATLLDHEAVYDVAVIGVPHSLWGEQCLALVIPRPGVPGDLRGAARMGQCTPIENPATGGGGVSRRVSAQRAWQGDEANAARVVLAESLTTQVERGASQESTRGPQPPDRIPAGHHAQIAARNDGFVLVP